MDKDLIILVAVGDICLGAGVRDSIRQFGSDFPFAQCSPILQNADVVFGNLEMVLYEKGTPLKENRLDFKAPLHYGEGLKRAGFRVLSVANNHILDFGAQACRDTLNFLKRQGIQTVGCGENLQEARKPAILTVRGKRIGFLAYSENVGQSAGPNQPGVAPIKKKYWVEDILALRPQVDLIVVSLHADLEFLAYPAPWRVRLSRQLIDAGADLVLQHHPHVPQGVERYGKGMIVYSLGSFVFPVYGNSYANHPYTDQSFVLRVWMGNRVEVKQIEVEAASLELDNTSSRLNNVWATGKVSQPAKIRLPAKAGNNNFRRMSESRNGGRFKICPHSFDATDYEIVGAEFLPVLINQFHQPVPLVGEDRQKFLMKLHKISLPLHDLEFLDRFWAISCRRSLCIHWSWLKEAYWDMGWREVLRRMRFLARTTENRRWLLGLVPGLVRFGFWDNL